MSFICLCGVFKMSQWGGEAHLFLLCSSCLVFNSSPGDVMLALQLLSARSPMVSHGEVSGHEVFRSQQKGLEPRQKACLEGLRQDCVSCCI